MPTPTKSYAVLQSEKKSHRTKAELERRKKSEAAMLTGVSMTEWQSTKNNIRAHKHFMRIRGLLSRVGRDDALNESAINRYCAMLAEASVLEDDLQSIAVQKAMLDDMEKNGELSSKEYLSMSSEIMQQKLAIEKVLGTKRKMLLDIEKESAMTIAAGLRTIPKKDTDEMQDDAMSDMLNRRMRVVQS